MIDKASVFAERFKSNPQILQATVLGQGPDPNLDPYTALRALQLIKESNAMAMAQQAQGPTSAPSLASQAVAPQGLAGMLPMGAPAGQMPQGQAPQGQMPQQMGQGQAPAMQASGGLAGMYTPEEDYAEGGIVAFSEPTAENNYSLVTSEGEAKTAGESEGEGDAALQAQAFANYEQSRKELEELTGDTTTPEQDKKTRKDYLDFLRESAGPDIYKPAMDRLNTRETDRAKTSRQGQGLALLAAAGAILEGNTLARGAAKAFPVFAKEMGEVQRADIAEQRSIEAMRFALADAQRKERMGDARGAQAAVEAARKSRADANKFKFDKTRALADLDAKAIQATRPRTGAGAGGPKLNELAFQANVDNLRETTKPNPGESPKAFDARIRAMAAEMTTKQVKTSFSTSELGEDKFIAATAPVQQRIDADVTKGLSDFKFENKEYRKAVRDKNGVEAQRLLDAEELRLRRVAERSQAAVTPSGGGSTRGPGAGKIPPPPPGFNPD